MEKINNKKELYKYSIKKYGKILTKHCIYFIILENELEKAKIMLKNTYKEERDYNKRNKL